MYVCMYIEQDVVLSIRKIGVMNVIITDQITDNKQSKYICQMSHVSVQRGTTQDIKQKKHFAFFVLPTH